MASSIELIGPPELNNPPQNPKPSSSPSKPPMGLTENLSPTFLSTGNPCLDFFFHIVPDTPPESLIERLQLAWKHNSLISLKLICHLRGVRGTGKSDKEGFYTAALWLHKNHPRTLACNVKWVGEFGYFKDLPEILYRILEGGDVRKVAKEEFEMRKNKGERKKFEWVSNKRGKMYYKREKKKVEGEKKERDSGSRESRLAVEMKKVKIQVENARELRKEREVAKARKAIERYKRDGDFRFLHDQISQVFADHLVNDLKFMNCGEFGKISLAAKWCPSLDSAFDKATLLCESIARKVFPRGDLYPEYEGIEDAHYAFRVRDRLRKEVLVPLRQILELPEVYMSRKEWNSLPYNRVASVAMTKYKKHFLKHDETRFNEFLGKVKSGEAKIAAGALFPHDIIKHLDDGEEDGGQVAELQWKRMVDDLSAKGKLQNCIAVCDVSGSMDGTPMEVCVALGLLMSELSEDPWKGKVITFSANPQLHIIQGDDLRSKTQFIRDMEWDMNTDFQKVFDMILQVAIAGNLGKEKMIKKIVVFSDMEFDECSAGNHPAFYGCDSDSNNSDSETKNDSEDATWNTDYEVIQRKFKESGYDVPEMVFWNLRDSMATPVPSDQKGVAMVSGFSKNLLTLFLDEEEIAGPEAMMEVALYGPEYQQLVVVD